MPRIDMTFVVQTLQNAHALPRFFHSLARQRAGLEGVEVLVAHKGGPLPPAVLLWRGILHSARFHVLPAPDAATTAQAMNAVLPWASGELVCPIPAGTRLDQRFVEAVSKAARNNPGTSIFTTDYIRVGGRTPGLVRLPVPGRKTLTARNAAGPVPILRNDALNRLRLRDRASFPAWDLALQGLAAGLAMTRIRLPLYSAPERSMPRSGLQGSHGLAATVLLNPGVFQSRQVRWALAVARRDQWALAHEPDRIPTGREVSRLYDEHVARTTTAGGGWLWRLAHPEPVPALQSQA